MATVIKLLLISLIVAGCGKKVNLSNTQLESASKIVLENGNQDEKYSGTLEKTTENYSNDKISYGGRYFYVSAYSSYAALKFISEQQPGSMTNVTFTGTVKSSEIVLKTIQKK